MQNSSQLFINRKLYTIVRNHFKRLNNVSVTVTKFKAGNGIVTKLLKWAARTNEIKNVTLREIRYPTLRICLDFA